MNLRFCIFVGLIYIVQSQQSACDKLINIFTDVSNTLSGNDFRIQQTFISTVIQNINNLNKVEYGKYAESDSSIIVQWNSSLSKLDYANTVMQTKQMNKSASIFRIFQELSLAILSDHNLHFSSIIFVTDTSNDAEINRAVETYKKILKPKVFLTLIATGDKAYVNKLAAFEAQVFDWTDFANPYPIGWDLNVAEGCFSSTSSSTSKLSAATATTTFEPYIPCEGFVTVLSDTSNILSPENFKKQITFTSSFLSHVSHFERIQYGSYCSANALIAYKWSPFNTQSQLQTTINDTVQQRSTTARLGNAMQLLIQSNPTSQTQITIIFITDTSSNFDIQKALSLYNFALKDQTKLTFILTGEKANAESLAEFDATIFDWRNMDLEVPQEWDAAKAFDCL